MPKNKHLATPVSISLVCLLGLLASCASTEPTVQEKAKRITELRHIAEDCLNRAQFSDDSPDGVDLEALQCYYESHKETAEIYRNASECPSCYARAGEGAALMGMYYYNLAQAQKRYIDERATEDELVTLKTLQTENDERAKEFFREAMQFFNIHLQNRSATDVRVYRRAYYVAIRLEDYKRALRYLDLWERNTRLTPEDKRVVDRWRESAERGYERSLLREASGESR